MIIVANWARFQNWKAFTDTTIHFQNPITDISGDNGTGKSTIADGYTFLFTGKDRQNRLLGADIKNYVLTELNSLPHIAEWEFDVDGSIVNIRRVYKEVWSRKKQAETPTHTGNTTEYFINDAPFTASQFEAFIATWADETTFKILTDPMFFNTLDADKWTWKKQREILAKMAGVITEQEIFDESEISKARQKVLADVFAKGTPLANYKEELKSKKKIAIEQLTPLQPAIDGKKTAKPPVDKWSEITKEIEYSKKELERLDSVLADKSKLTDEKEKQKDSLRSKIRSIGRDIEDIKEGIQRKIKKDNDEIRDKKASLESDISRIETNIKSIERDNESRLKRVESLKIDLNAASAAYKLKKKEQEPDFDGEDAVCKVCEHPLKPEVIAKNKEKFLENWRAEKVKNLNYFRKQGEDKVAEIEKITKEVSDSAQVVEGLEKDLEAKKALLKAENEKKLGGAEELNKLLAEHKDNILFAADLVKAQEDLKKLEDAASDDDSIKEEISKIKTDKSELSDKITALSIRLSKKEDIERIDKQIDELERQKKALTQTVADYEGMEHAIKNYEFTRAQIIQRRVNRLFRVDADGKSISFKMFKENVDKTDREEWCELQYDGKPWSALSTGQKTYAGLECINAFNEFYNKYFPVIIDNRESTVRIPQMNTQIINLRVDENQPTIIVME